MDMRGSTAKPLVAVVCLVFCTACASSTTIRSRPTGVKVYINGEYAGKTPYTHTDTSIVGSTKHVRLEKEGCESFTASFSRSEEFSVGACIGGVFVFVPFLWIMGYKPERTFEMACANSGDLSK